MQVLSPDLVRFTYEGKDYFYSTEHHSVFSTLDDIRGKPHPDGQPLQPTVKIYSMWLNLTDLCNLACSYCFNPPSSGARRDDSPSHFMTKEVAQSAVIMLARLWKKHQGGKAAKITFFGGEPLLNFEVLEHTVHFAREWTTLTRVPFSFLISTNGTLLDRQLVDFFALEDFYIQVSLDGPQAIHDRHRKYSSGKGSYAKIMENTHLLSKIPRQKLNIRSTIAQGAPPLSSIARFFQEQGFERIEMKFVSNNNIAGLGLTETDIERLGEDLDAAVDAIIQVRENGVSLQPFEEHLRSLENQHWRKYICAAGSAAVSVDPEGWIYPCHRFHGNPDYRIAHVTGEFSDDIGREFASLRAANISPCNSCWAVKFCWGCCPAEGVAFGKPLGHPNEGWCKMKQLGATVSLKLAAATGLVNQP